MPIQPLTISSDIVGIQSPPTVGKEKTTSGSPSVDAKKITERSIKDSPSSTSTVGPSISDITRHKQTSKTVSIRPKSSITQETPTKESTNKGTATTEMTTLRSPSDGTEKITDCASKNASSSTSTVNPSISPISQDQEMSEIVVLRPQSSATQGKTNKDAITTEMTTSSSSSGGTGKNTDGSSKDASSSTSTVKPSMFHITRHKIHLSIQTILFLDTCETTHSNYFKDVYPASTYTTRRVRAARSILCNQAAIFDTTTSRHICLTYVPQSEGIL